MIDLRCERDLETISRRLANEGGNGWGVVNPRESIHLNRKGRRETVTATVMHAPSQAFLRFVLANPVNAALLARLPLLGLPDGYVVAGCLFQSVWNGLSGLPATHGIHDYDIFYFDGTDLSWEAEDAIIRRCAVAFADLEVEVQIRNQARVHLWYPQKHGIACPPLQSSRDGIDTFLNQSSCFGVRAESHGSADVYAPFGYDDLFSMVVRPNLRRVVPKVYYEKAERWRQLWPMLTVVPWPVEGSHQTPIITC
jgi:uncharacterized protein